jgi:hypothetical protein
VLGDGFGGVGHLLGVDVSKHSTRFLSKTMTIDEKKKYEKKTFFFKKKVHLSIFSTFFGMFSKKFLKKIHVFKKKNFF